MNLLLPVLLVFPLVGALAMYPLRENPRAAKQVAVGTALLQFVLAAITWSVYSVDAAEAGTRFQLEFAVDWIPATAADQGLIDIYIDGHGNGSSRPCALAQPVDLAA